MLKYVLCLLLALGTMPDVIAQPAAGAAPEVRSEAADPPVVRPNVITWSTASEHDSFGYDVYRGRSESGPFAAVNAEVIPGAGTTDVPRHYEFVDDTIEPDTIYWYYIESISLTGERKRITPIHASKPRPAEPASE